MTSTNSFNIYIFIIYELNSIFIYFHKKKMKQTVYVKKTYVYSNLAKKLRNLKNQDSLETLPNGSPMRNS